MEIKKRGEGLARVFFLKLIVSYTTFPMFTDSSSTLILTHSNKFKKFSYMLTLRLNKKQQHHIFN